MPNTTPRMSNLFLQLGLDASEEAIAEFIGKNQLATNVSVVDAPFWTEGQRQFLEEKLASDGAWTTVVDQLSEALQDDAIKSQTDQ